MTADDPSHRSSPLSTVSGHASPKSERETLTVSDSPSGQFTIVSTTAVRTTRKMIGSRADCWFGAEPALGSVAVSVTPSPTTFFFGRSGATYQRQGKRKLVAA